MIAIHNWSLLHVLPVGTPSWWMDDILFTAGRWAVPVFVMISGGLLLRPSIIDAPGAFYRRRLTRIGLPTVFWIAAYFVFRATFLEEDLTRREIASDLVMATPFVHLYFLYVIVGLYLVAPAVAAFISRTPRWGQGVAAAALLAIPALESIAAVTLGTRGSGVTGLTYWIPFLGYFLAGHVLFGLTTSARVAALILGGVVVVIAAQILTVYLIARAGGPLLYPTGYFSVFTIAAAVLIYTFCARNSAGQNVEGPIGAVVTGLGAATFGVYLVHEMLLHWHARTFVSGTPEELMTARIPTYFIGLIGSFAIVLVARRIPVVRSVF